MPKETSDSASSFASASGPVAPPVPASELILSDLLDAYPNRAGMIHEEMIEYLSDLFGHQEWADPVHWRAAESHPGAPDDDDLRGRLDNIQAVQRAFLTVWKGALKWPEPLESYTTALAIRVTPVYHHDVAAFLRALDPARLEEIVTVPWSPIPAPSRPPPRHHAPGRHAQPGYRAQNAPRLSALGGAAPLTDYIVWILNARPTPVWTDAPEALGTC